MPEARFEVSSIPAHFTNYLMWIELVVYGNIELESEAPYVKMALCFISTMTLGRSFQQLY